MITKKTNLSTERLKSIAIVLAGTALFSLTIESFLSFAQKTSAQSLPTITDRQPPRQELTAPRGGDYNPFTNITLEGNAAFVFDLTTGQPIFEMNADVVLPLASLTKIMTALVARTYIPESTTLTLSSEDLETEGDTGLRPGEVWRLTSLLDVMLTISSNDAAHAISRFVGSYNQEAGQYSPSESRERFIEIMNTLARNIGLSQATFFNESGLDVNAEKNGGYATAREVGIMLIELYKRFPSAVEVTSRENVRITSQSGFVHIIPNTNGAIGHFPGLVASKTGYTSLAGGNLAILFDVGIGHPVAAVVLGSTYQGRFDDMQKLVEAARASIQSKNTEARSTVQK